MAKRFRKTRLTRKEIKQDRFIESTMEAVSELKHHSTKVVFGAVIFVVLILTMVFYFNSKRKAESLAVADLSNAIALYSANDFTSSIQRLEQHLLQFENTKSGEKARFFLANSRYYNDDFDGALQDFQRYLERNSKDPLFSPSALMGIASCREQKGEWGEAASNYEEVRNRYPDSFLVPEALVSSGRCREKLREWDAAERLYKEVVENYPEQAFSADAETYLALLKGRRAVQSESPETSEAPKEILPETTP
jgi:TolA-binding protein